MGMFEKIARLLEEQGIGQLAFERRAGLPPNRISKWKAGQGQPTGRQLVAMARLLGVTAEYLADDRLTSPVAAGLTEDQRHILRVVRTLGIDADTAVQRLIQAPAVQPAGPTYEQLKAAARRRNDGGRGA
jgi:transcriptional regulator with XRE-family HTH domain